mgnify:CR=1 FL=1
MTQETDTSLQAAVEQAGDRAETGCEKRVPPLKPVSYTHLRAHETVLDLVCRLLLEKKKHNNSNTQFTFVHKDIRTHTSSSYLFTQRHMTLTTVQHHTT